MTRVTLTVKKGAAAATKQARALPYAKEVTVYRDALSGQFARPPSRAESAGTVQVTLHPQAADVLVFSHLLDWGDGSAPEVVRVAVECQSARAARLMGELMRSELKTFEDDLKLSTLQDLNPQRAKEYELEALHQAHRTAKGQRAAHSRKRNAQARAEDQSKGHKARTLRR